jgi:hypothetical protein
MSTTLSSGLPVSVLRVTHASPPEVLSTVHELLNTEIRAGNSYPQENELSLDQFLAYFLSHDAFVVVNGRPESTETVGAFYVKPNYPGRWVFEVS